MSNCFYVLLFLSSPNLQNNGVAREPKYGLQWFHVAFTVINNETGATCGKCALHRSHTCQDVLICYLVAKAKNVFVDKLFVVIK